MQKLKTMKLTARVVSWILIGIIFLLVGLIGVSSWYMQKQLAAGVVSADHAKIQAELSQTELQRAEKLSTYFIDNRAAVDKATAVVADTRTYQYGYQDQIVRDIQSYAAKAGVSVTGYAFPEQAANSSPDTTGLKSVTAILTLDAPVQYRNLLLFLKYIEQNVTRMQITDLQLTPATDNANSLSAVGLTLKVYVR